MASQIMWSFKTARFEVRWTIEDCYDLDLSWDEDGTNRRGLEDGSLTAFDSVMEVYFDGVRVGWDSLGESIYANPVEFRTNGGYFPDMVREAIDQARNLLGGLYRAAPPAIRHLR